ncbi:MAG: AEC family transporter [Ruminococcaceae bacterium]|nr:AEC family transporter [Oscillospiraceae bacterium]
MKIILEQLFILYLFLCLGWFFGKRKPKNTEQTGILSYLLVNLFLPCKVFRSFATNFTTEYLSKNWKLPLIGLGMLVLLVLISLPLSKLLTKHPYEKRVYQYSIPICNYAYMGYVLIEESFGSAALTGQILFCIPMIIYTYSIGFVLLTGNGFSWKKMVNPMTCSIFLGAVTGLSGLKLPGLVTGILSGASGCVGPLSMLLVGISLSAFSVKKLLRRKVLYVFSVLRLVLIPLIAFGLCKLLGLDEVLLFAIIVTCMPCGLNTIVFPKLVGEDCSLGAGLVLTTHALSCVTLPFWLMLIT